VPVVIDAIRKYKSDEFVQALSTEEWEKEQKMFLKHVPSVNSRRRYYIKSSKSRSSSSKKQSKSRAPTLDADAYNLAKKNIGAQIQAKAKSGDFQACIQLRDDLRELQAIKQEVDGGTATADRVNGAQTIIEQYI
jgi:excinuclease UvrABC helicase subunit UvrB